MKFIDYLRGQKQRHDPVGDFARDALHVLKYPADYPNRQPNGSSDLRKWIEALSDSPTCVKAAATRAFLEYYGLVGYPKWLQELQSIREFNADTLLIWLENPDDEDEDEEFDIDTYLNWLKWTKLLGDESAEYPDRFPKARAFRLNLRTRFLIFRRDGFRCQVCGRSSQDGAILEVDHKHPKSKGGDDSYENLWTLCFDCNRGKNDLHPYAVDPAISAERRADAAYQEWKRDPSTARPWLEFRAELVAEGLLEPLLVPAEPCAIRTA